LSLGKRPRLTRFLRSVRSQVSSSHRRTDPRLVFACSGNLARPPAAGSVAGRRRNSFLVDEGCRVTFGDHLARRHCLLGPHRRLISSGLCPASCDSRARIEMRCWAVGGNATGMHSIDPDGSLRSQVLYRRRQFYRQGMCHAFGHCVWARIDWLGVVNRMS
jgi:hypothetical protein